MSHNYNRNSHVHNALQKYHRYNCNRDSHLHNYSKNYHPHICSRNSHLCDCIRKIHQHTSSRKYHLKTCINATDVVTCTIAIESVSCIVPPETVTCRIDCRNFYLQKWWEGVPTMSCTSVSVAKYASISLNMPKHPWKCFNKLFWLCQDSECKIILNVWQDFEDALGSKYARVLNMVIYAWMYAKIMQNSEFI